MENSKQPAFPVEVCSDGKGVQTSSNSGMATGLTKREYLAAMAMQGYCGGEYIGQSGMPHEKIAEWSVKMADELLKQLDNPK